MFTHEEIHTLGMMGQAICELRPGATWELPRPDYSSLVWKDETQWPPSFDEVKARMDELEEEYRSREWIRRRIAEYPPIPDQLDMIFHDGIDAWRQSIQDIKDRIPKPNEII